MENQNNEKKEKKNTVKKCFIVGGTLVGLGIIGYLGWKKFKKGSIEIEPIAEKVAEEFAETVQTIHGKKPWIKPDRIYRNVTGRVEDIEKLKH